MAVPFEDAAVDFLDLYPFLYWSDHPASPEDHSDDSGFSDDSNMPRVRYIDPLRSDGVLEVRKGGKTETNAPTEDQLQKKKMNDVFVWYEEVPHNDPKHLDWRKKLGGLMITAIYESMENVAEEPNPEEYVFSRLPDNYRLFEHCRQMDLEKPGAGGNKDRRDAYLYGHPEGRKKRFRSPGDFFKHLMWLGSDKQFDHDNCSCKLCNPDEVLRAGMEMAKMQKEDLGKSPDFAKDLEAAKEVPAKTGSTKDAKNKKKEKSAVTKSVDTTPTLPEEPAVEPEPLPDPLPLAPSNHPEQLKDLEPGGPFFRIGELVWYVTTDGVLGLGVLLNRKIDPATYPPTAQWLLQPLSAPTDFLPPRLINDNYLFPFLAYSVPRPANSKLHDPKLHFGNIKWEELPKDRNRIVDGSSFAAQAIDNTYTLVQPLTDPGAQTMEFEYNGIYLGAELIWLGDGVRYQANLEGRRNEWEMLVVSKIVNRIHTGSKPAEVYFVGDVYKWRQPLDTAESVPPSVHVPFRMQENIRMIQQTRRTFQQLGIALEYSASQVRATLGHIHGRCYESIPTMERLRPKEVQEALKTGHISPAGVFLNPRGMNLPTGTPGTRKVDRLDAYWRAVPGEPRPQINFEGTGSELVGPTLEQSRYEFTKDEPVQMTEEDLALFS